MGFEVGRIKNQEINNKRAIILMAALFLLSWQIIDLMGAHNWLANEFYNYINQDVIVGQVAGEYTVSMAAESGPNFFPSYPKIMRANAAFPQSRRTAEDYSDGATPLIFSKYDAVAFSRLSIKDPANQAFAQEIKNYNPETIVLGFLGSMLRMPAGAPDDYRGTGSYYSYRADGTKNNAYAQLQGEALVNFTKQIAGRYAITNSNGTGFYDGVTKNDLKYFDGVLYPDGRSGFAPFDLCSDPRYKNLDFNENGLADTEELGNSCSGSKNVDEINTRWADGYDAKIKKEKEVGSLIKGVDWKVVVNDGGPPIRDKVTPKTSTENFKKLIDGFEFENAPEWQDLKNRIIDWDKNGQKPSLVNWVDTVGRKNRNWMKDGQNNFQGMRFNLGTALMGDVYYGLCLGEGNNLCFWYDEFDADLGKPVSAAQEITKYCQKLCPPTWGCPNYCPMVRFFEQGAVIINPSGQDVTITKNDIEGLTGYDNAGSYYRFYGGQDPVMNNGDSFGSVDLKSTVDDPNKQQKKLTSGDGIILINKENTFLVSEVVVGNSRHDDTTPGNKPAEFIGSWGWELTQGRDLDGKGNPYYTQFLGKELNKAKVCKNSWNDCKNDENCASGETCVLPQDATNGVEINDGFPARYTTDSGATAIFTPNIGQPGEYEVFEWHGWHGPTPNNDEATNVELEIKHKDGTKRMTINQRENYGQWNSLGKYSFNKGEEGYVKILATGASASNVVIADAVRFVYTQNSIPTMSLQEANMELISDFNCDEKIDVIDFGILLSYWDKKDSDGINNYVNNECYRNLDLVVDKKIDSLDFVPLLGCWGVNNMPVCWQEKDKNKNLYAPTNPATQN